jgi:hypothetical protein
MGQAISWPVMLSRERDHEKSTLIGLDRLTLAAVFALHRPECATIMAAVF